MEALLVSLNSKVEELSVELNGMKQDLKDIKLDCTTLREEFRRVTTGKVDGASIGFVEGGATMTAKEMLQEILCEIKMLKLKPEVIRAPPGKRREDFQAFLLEECAAAPSTVPTRAPSTALVLQEEGKAGTDGEAYEEFPVVEIAFPQGEESHWLEKYSKLKKRLRVPAYGATLPEQSAPNWIGEEDKQMSVSILIRNYSASALSNPQTSLEDGHVTGSVCSSVPGQTQEVICFNNYVKAGTGCIYGACSYQIGSSPDLRLTVRFDLQRQAYRREPTGFSYGYALAFTPASIPVDSNMLINLDACADILSTTDISSITVPEYRLPTYAHNQARPLPPGPRAIKSKTGNLAALGSLSVDEDSSCLLIEVDFIQLPPEQAEAASGAHFQTRPIQNGYTMLDGAIPLEDFARKFLRKTGCVLEIRNQLNVPLEDFDSYINNALEIVLPPFEIPAFTQEMFYVSAETCADGMFVYTIGGTDLQLDFGFWLGPSGNSFALRFSRRGTAKKPFQDCFSEPGPWKTQPYIFANASEGEEVLEFRNLRVNASMSSGAKAILKLRLSAF